jgi:hypothetical protein
LRGFDQAVVAPYPRSPYPRSKREMRAGETALTSKHQDRQGESE